MGQEIRIDKWICDVGKWAWAFCCCILLLMMVSSCEKPEAPIKLPPKPGDSLRLFSVEMGDQYDKQVFVNLDNEALTIVNNNSWDLYFNTADDAAGIYINGGKGILIASVGTVTFRQSIDPASLKWKWDEASGYDDSLALHGWMDRSSKTSYDSVYVIDRGAAVTGNDRYCQFKIVSADADKFMLRVASADGSNEHDVNVPKDKSKAHVYLSFDNGGTYLNFEPPKNAWHICFLRYRFVYHEYNPPLLYPVSGIYINNTLVSASVDSSLGFYDVTFKQCKGLQFNSQRDAMGFDWKVYNFSTGKYRTRDYVNYFLKPNDNPDLMYKIRFVDYYSSGGLKGYPKFEYEKMWW